MKALINRTFLVTIITGMVLNGCKKIEPLDTDIYVAMDNALAEGAFQDMFAIVLEESAISGLADITTPHFGKTLDDCPTVTLSEEIGVFPNTMTIDFGDSCYTYLGLKRSGILTVTFTGFYKDAGTLIHIEPDNYYLNDNKIEGDKFITNEGLNDAGNIYFTITVADAILTLETGEMVTWDATRTREWTEGTATSDLTDDVYSISDGPFADFSAAGINRNGTSFKVHIAEPIIKRMDCKWLTKGVLEITPDEFQTRVIDFGEGECDDEATLTIGDFVTSITFPF